jgi:hypothetical protein
MVRCSVLLRWFDVWHKSYAIVCVLRFIWVWQKSFRALSWSEHNILIYTRTPTQNDSCIPERLICIFTFHSLSEVSSWVTISPVWCNARCFSLEALSWPLPYVYRRCLENVESFLTTLPTPPPPKKFPWYFDPLAHQQLYFCSRLCHPLFDVPLEL